jgi:hypothetical protein
MTPQRFLQHDILLLCARWADGEHFPSNRSIAGWDWRTYYEQRLEATIAQWLAGAFFSWQFECRRPTAFAPIAHLVGTAREDTYYLESIVRLCDELRGQSDRYYRPPPDPMSATMGPVLIGPCLENGAALAFDILAQRPFEHPREHFHALHDLLCLIQAVRPLQVVVPLCHAWSTLFLGPGAPHTPFTEQEIRILKHQLILALYPACHAGNQNEPLGELIKLISDTLPNDPASAPMRADLNATYAMIYSTEESRVSGDEPDIPVRQPEPLHSNWLKPWNCIRAPSPASQP